MDLQAASHAVTVAEEQYQRQVLSVFPRLVMGPAFEIKDTRGVPGRNVFGDLERTSVAKGKLTAPTIQSKNQRDFARSQIIDTLTGGFLQITVPIWDQNQAQIAKARFVADQRHREFKALLNTVAMEVDQTSIALNIGLELIHLYDGELLPQAHAGATAAEDSYRQGKQSITAMIEARRFLMNQQQAYYIVQRDAAIAAAALRRAVGGRPPGYTADLPSTSQPAIISKGGQTP